METPGQTQDLLERFYRAVGLGMSLRKSFALWTVIEKYGLTLRWTEGKWRNEYTVFAYLFKYLLATYVHCAVHCAISRVVLNTSDTGTKTFLSSKHIECNECREYGASFRLLETLHIPGCSGAAVISGFGVAVGRRVPRRLVGNDGSWNRIPNHISQQNLRGIRHRAWTRRFRVCVCLFVCVYVSLSLAWTI